MVSKNELFFLGVLSFTLGMFVVLEAVLYNLFVLDVLKLTYLDVGIMVAVSSAVGTTFFIIWGAISDNIETNFGRRRPFILVGGICGGLFVIAFTLVNSLIMIILIDGFLISVSINALNPAYQALIRDLTITEERGKMSSWLRINNLAGSGFCFILTYLLIRGFNIPNNQAFLELLDAKNFLYISLIVGTFLIIVSVMIFLFISEQRQDKTIPKGKSWYKEIQRTFRPAELIKEKDFFLFLTANFVLYIGLYSFIPFFVPFFTTKFTFGDLITLIPFVAAGFILSFFVFGFLSDMKGRKNLTIIGTVGAAVSFICVWINEVLLGSNFFIWLIFMFIASFQGVGFVIIAFAWVLDLVPEEKRGQFLGYNNIITGYSQIPGALLGGTIAVLFGITTIFLISAICFIFSTPIFLMVRETV